MPSPKKIRIARAEVPQYVMASRNSAIAYSNMEHFFALGMRKLPRLQMCAILQNRNSQYKISHSPRKSFQNAPLYPREKSLICNKNGAGKIPAPR